MTERVVLCMKWGTVFPAGYVNRLFRAVRDHLTGPFRFVCLTDDPEGLHADIEVFPIPDLGLPPEKYRHGAWPKLGVYRKDLYGLEGRCLFIDLDSVIVGSLDEFFEEKAPYMGQDGGPDWRRGRKRRNPTLNTTTFAFTVGEQAQILESFMSDKRGAFAAHENDQQYAEAYARGLEYWPEGWIVSFKRHLCQPIVRDLFLPPSAPDPATKIVAFHGDPRPIELVGRRGLWTKFPHSVRCPVPWLDAYWDRYGD